jgi:hypothetical protein
LYGRFFLFLPSISRFAASAFAAVARLGRRVEITCARLLGLLVGDIELSFGESTLVLLAGAEDSVSLSLESLSVEAIRFADGEDSVFLRSWEVLLMRGLGVTTLFGIGLGAIFGDLSREECADVSDRLADPRGESGASSSDDESKIGGSGFRLSFDFSTNCS